VIQNNKNRFNNDFRVDTSVLSCRIPVEMKADLIKLASLHQTTVSTIVYTLIKEELTKSNWGLKQ